MTAEDLIGLETMLPSSPDDTALHDDAGVLALLLGRPAAAVSALPRHRRSAVQTSATAHYNLATALTQAGLFDDAVASYERALALRPRYAKALSNLGDALVVGRPLRRGDPPLRSGRGRRSAMPEAHNNLGAALWRKGELPRAERELREALRLRPDYAEAFFNLGHTAVRARRLADAAAHFRAAATLKDDWPAALTTAAWVLSTAGDAAIREPAQAVTFAERAVGLTARREARTLDVLAVAYASAGRFDDAVAAAREAQVLAEPALAKEIALRLALFERRQAYVDEP